MSSLKKTLKNLSPKMEMTKRQHPAYRAWLDLTEMQIDRPTMRRLEKQLKSSDEFEKKSGRVLFFRFYTELSYRQFFAAMTHALTQLGERFEIRQETEEDILKQSIK